MDERDYPISKHLGDLRTCLWRAVLGVCLATLLCYGFADQLLWWLRQPMEAAFQKNSHFIVLAPQEYFFTQMKAAAYFGLFLASPWIFYQIWRFIAPGLHKAEKKTMLIFVSAGAGFFIAGSLFAYFVAFPVMFKFFISTLPPDIDGAYSIGVLFGTAIQLLLAFGVVFEAPLIVILLAMLGIVQLETLSKYRRHMIVAAFIVAALLSPPDVVSQVMMAIPLLILYEVGVLAARFLVRPTKVS